MIDDSSTKGSESNSASRALGLRTVPVPHGPDGSVQRLPFPCRSAFFRLHRRTVDGAVSARPELSSHVHHGRYNGWTGTSEISHSKKIFTSLFDQPDHSLSSSGRRRRLSHFKIYDHRSLCCCRCSSRSTDSLVNSSSIAV